MQFSVLGLVVCLVIAAGCAAMGAFGRLAARRQAKEQAREHAEWAAMQASLLDLDGDLNRVWAKEAGRRGGPGGVPPWALAVPARAAARQILTPVPATVQRITLPHLLQTPEACHGDASLFLPVRPRHAPATRG